MSDRTTLLCVRDGRDAAFCEYLARTGELEVLPSTILAVGSASDPPARVETHRTDTHIVELSARCEATRFLGELVGPGIGDAGRLPAASDRFLVRALVSSALGTAEVGRLMVPLPIAGFHGVLSALHPDAQLEAFDTRFELGRGPLRSDRVEDLWFVSTLYRLSHQGGRCSSGWGKYFGRQVAVDALAFAEAMRPNRGGLRDVSGPFGVFCEPTFRDCLDNAEREARLRNTISCLTAKAFSGIDTLVYVAGEGTQPGPELQAVQEWTSEESAQLLLKSREDADWCAEGASAIGSSMPVPELAWHAAVSPEARVVCPRSETADLRQSSGVHPPVGLVEIGLEEQLTERLELIGSGENGRSGSFERTLFQWAPATFPWLRSSSSGCGGRLNRAGPVGRHLMAIADADSYVKWADAVGRVVFEGWETSLFIVRSSVAPSRAQLASLLPTTTSEGSRARFVSLPSVRSLVRRYKPDAVLVAAAGPQADGLMHAVRTGWPDAVIVTGLPGIGIPSTDLTCVRRHGADILMTHSPTEMAQYRQRLERLGLPMEATVDRLAILDDVEELALAGHQVPGRIVFAPQAKVPASREAREQILAGLAEIGRARSGDGTGYDVVVKLRAVNGEGQTHNEPFPYDALWTDMVASGRVDGDELRFAAGAMSTWLKGATALVTVSSTAALEGIQAGVRVHLLSDFGVTRFLLNEVYLDSGLECTVREMCDFYAGVSSVTNLGRASGSWLAKNYFFDSEVIAARAPVIRGARGAVEDRLADAAPTRCELGECRLPSRVRRRVWLTSLLPTPVVRVLSGLARKVRHR